MAMSSQNNGILLVFECDGKEWATHITGLLRHSPYNLPCTVQHWWNLTNEIATDHPVHVLIFSPVMKAHISCKQFSYLRNQSDRSLFLECNAHSNEIKMPAWKVVKHIDRSPKNLAEVLSTIEEMYSFTINDGNCDAFTDDADDEVDDFHPGYVNIDIVPNCLYPGERRIYILFNERPENSVKLTVDSMPELLMTTEYTKNCFIYDFPEIESERMMVSVYVEGNERSLFRKMIAYITSDYLLENYVDNLKETLPFKSCNSIMPQPITFYNPFSDDFCEAERKEHFAKKIANLYKNEPFDIDESPRYARILDVAEQRNRFDGSADVSVAQIRHNFTERQTDVTEQYNGNAAGRTSSNSSPLENLRRILFRKKNDSNQKKSKSTIPPLPRRQED